VGDSEGTLAVEPPRGMYPGKLDDKGRIKVPVQFQHYLASLSDKKLFVTSIDRRTAQVYPMNVWRENERFFENYREDTVAARHVLFNAQDLGAEAEMDSQGRIVFPPELRRELEIENQPVRIYANRDRIEVLSERIYEEERRQAAVGASDAARKLEAAGLK
jgi:MraZ protein